MSDGRGASCAEIDKERESSLYHEGAEELRRKMAEEDEKAASKPLWLKELNKKAWASQLTEDKTNFSEGLSRISVLGVEKRADVGKEGREVLGVEKRADVGKESGCFSLHCCTLPPSQEVKTPQERSSAILERFLRGLLHSWCTLPAGALTAPMR